MRKALSYEVFEILLERVAIYPLKYITP